MKRMLLILTVQALVNALDSKPYWPGKLPGVSHENPGFSDSGHGVFSLNSIERGSDAICYLCI